MGDQESRVHQQFDEGIMNDERDYIKIYSFPYSQRDKHLAQGKYPDFYVIDDVHITLRKIMQELSESNSEIRELKDPYFTLNNQPLSYDSTIKQLKEELKANRCNGAQLYISQKANTIDQNCPIDLLVGRPGSDPQKEHYTKFRINYELVQNQNNPNYTLTKSFDVFKTFREVINEFEDMAFKQFNVNLDIRQYAIKDSDDKQGRILSKELLRRNIDQDLQNIPFMKNYLTIQASLQPHIKLNRRHINPYKRIIIYKENSNEYIQEPFDKYELWTFKNIYHLLLEPTGRQVSSSSKRCLALNMDIIVTQSQNLSGLSQYYGASDKVSQLGFVLVTRVITEEMYFYKIMQQLIPSSTNPQKIFQKCMYRQRNQSARQPIAAFYQLAMRRAQLSPCQYFRKFQNLLAIYAYSFERTERFDEIQGRAQPIYISLNKTLRSSNLFQQFAPKVKRKWAFQFSSKLLRDLMHVPTIKANSQNNRLLVFRGVKADLKLRTNQVYSYKCFMSTSLQRQVAEDFIRSNNNTKRSTLMIIQLQQGKDISAFSAYGEQQILLEPYSHFEVTNVRTREMRIDDIWVDIVEMRQLPKYASNYVKFIQEFIIWIDADLELEQNLFRAIRKFRNTTVLLQMRSTKELSDWLKLQTTQKLLQHEQARFVFISNMAGLEENERGIRSQNQAAGIQGLIKFQEHQAWRDVPVMFFVRDQRDKDQANKILQHRMKELKNFEQIKVTASVTQLARFLQRHLSIQFGNLTSLRSSQQSMRRTMEEVHKQEEIQKPNILSQPIIKRYNKQQGRQRCQLI